MAGGSTSLCRRLRQWADRLKADVVVLAVAVRDPRVPTVAKLLAAIVVAYALSPIDLIPDFIPVLGYLDDILLLPLGIWLVLRLVPDDVLAAIRAEQVAKATADTLPRSKTAAMVIIALWVLAMLALAAWLQGRFGVPGV